MNLKLPKSNFLDLISKWWLPFSLLLTLILRIPSLFEPYWYGDEGVYLTLGMALNKGLVFYSQIHDNKPPLLYLLTALAGNLFWLRFLLLVWSLITVYLFTKLATILFKNKWAIILATFSFVILTSISRFEGNIANAEIFMILPTLFGFYLFFEGEEKNDFRNFFFIGWAFSIATLFKVPSIFDFAAFCFFYLFFYFQENLTLKRKFFNLIIVGLGFLHMILLTVIYYGAKGALTDYLKAAFLQNIGYLSSWQTGTHASTSFSQGVTFRGLILVLILSILWILRKRVSLKESLIYIWFIFSLFGALLSGRPYPHYLIQVFPPACFLLIILLTSKRVAKVIAIILFALLVFINFYFKFWVYPTINYYQNFLKYALKQETKDQYYSNFDPITPTLYQIADYLKSRTKKDEKIFVWSDTPSIYALADRIPVGKYVAAYHIADFNKYQETIEKLETDKPKFIVVMKDTKNFSDLEKFLKQNYLLVKEVNQAKIYHLSF